MRAEATTTAIEKRTSQNRWIMAVFYFCIVTAAAILISSPASGQDKKEKDPKLANRPIALKAKDNIKLRGFYFPSDKGKEAVTVMVIHEWGGQAAPYQNLVTALKEAGCAVVIPDYRGHGGSRSYTDMKGNERQFNFAQMTKADVANIINLDLEATKRFLKEENNAGRLNMNALVVIGDGEGCILGAHWTQRDWSFPTVGARKRGQDVKGLVLISPDKVLMGLSLEATLSNAAIMAMPMMLISGESSKQAATAKRVHKKVEAVRKRAAAGREVQGLELNLVKTSLNGPSFINQPDVIPNIVKFVTENVIVDEETNPWIERK